MIYGINILITPKSGDLYDAVAVNKAPIFIQCENEQRLIELLKTNESIRQAVNGLMKIDSVKRSARFCYRCLDTPEKISYLECNFD